MPGAPGGLGTDVDGLEGFARVGPLAGARFVGEQGKALHVAGVVVGQRRRSQIQRALVTPV